MPRQRSRACLTNSISSPRTRGFVGAPVDEHGVGLASGRARALDGAHDVERRASIADSPPVR